MSALESGASGFDGGERFELRRRLGTGGMGVVYEALDRESGELVALKTLRDPTPDALLRLKTEFRVAQGIRHRNLVSLGELHECQGWWFFTMELVDGTDLLTWVRGEPSPDHGAAAGAHRGGRLDEAHLRAALRQVAQGLRALHEGGCIHRDLKPANILVDRQGRAVILDFGVACFGSPTDAATGPAAAGTAAYMAPEQARGQTPGPAADWYSLGVILYESLTGERPFGGGPVEVLVAKQQSAPPAPGTRVSGLPADLEQLCVELLRTDPAARPGEAEILARIAGDAGPPEDPRVAPDEEEVFVGRAAELALLEATAEQAVHGQITTAVVIGESGTGKTLLVRRFLRALAELAPGTLILTGACYERESVPFKAFDAIIDQLCRWWMALPPEQAARYVPLAAEPLCRLFPVMGSVPVLLDGLRREELPPDPQELRAQAFAALREILGRLAERQALVLAIDDVQWADQDSLDLLRALFRPPDPPPLLLLGTWRHAPEAGPVRKALERFEGWIAGGLTPIVVGRLEPRDALALATRLLARGERAPDPDQANAIAERAGGHPLFIHELARHGHAHPELPSGSVTLDAVIVSRTQALEPGARELVEGVTMAGRPVAVEVLAAALETAPARVRQLAERLEGVGLVRTSRVGSAVQVATFHDRVREALTGSLPEAARQAWHRRLAEAYARTGGGTPELLAEHLAAAGRTAEAARQAAIAASEAVAQLAFGRAVRLYRRALELDAGSGRTRGQELILQLASALACAGRGVKAAEAYLRAAARSGPEDGLKLRQRAADQLLRSGNVDQGMALLAEVLANLGLQPLTSPRRALLELLLRRVTLRLFPGQVPLRPEAEVPPATLLRLDILDSLATSFACVDNLGAAGFATRFAHEALRAGEPRRVLKGLIMESNFLAGSGKAGTRYARRTRARFEALQAQLPDTDLRAWCEHRDAVEGFMAGSWAESAEQARAAAQSFQTHRGAFYEVAISTFFELWSRFYLGEFDALARRVPLAVAEAYSRGDRFGASGLVLGLANLGLVLREGPGLARRRVDEFIEHWSVQGYHLQHYYALLARTHLDLYEDRGADALARVQADWPELAGAYLLLMPAVRHEAVHLRARAALAAAGQTSGAARTAALRLASRDARFLARRPVAWTRALAPLVTAGVAALKGEVAGAVRDLESAVAELDACGMRGYAAAARYRLGQLVPGAPGEGHREAVRAVTVQEHLGAVAPRLWQVLAPGFPAERPDPQEG